MKRTIAAALAAATLLSLPLAAQDAPERPGILDPSRVTAGSYATDPGHTLIGFRVNHFGFNDYFGIFGGATGTLTLDPADLEAARVEISIPLADVTTASPGLTAHLQTADFLDTANHPAASFVSTRIDMVDGLNALIEGDLTIRGVTRPITLEARFTGAGTNPFSNRETIGFEATGTVSRHAYGIDYARGLVGDEVELTISVAFEKS